MRILEQKRRKTAFSKSVFLFLVLFLLPVLKTTAQTDSIFAKPHHELAFMPTFEKLQPQKGEANLTLPISLGYKFQYLYIYNLNKNWAISAGAGIGRHSLQFNFPSDSVSKKGLDINKIKTKVFTASLPINIIARTALQKNSFLSAYVGVNFNTLLAGNFSASSSIETSPNNNIAYQLTEYSMTAIPQAALNFGFSVDKKMKNNNFISIGLSANFNFKEVVKINYNLYPEINTKSKKGFISSNASYIGLKFGYIFTNYKKK